MNECIIDIKENLTALSDSSYILIEFARETLGTAILDAVHELKLKGYRPVVAHIEMYSDVVARPDIVKEIRKSGGINYNKKGLNQLIDMITNSEVEKIVILYKDRLLSFGFEMIENLCNKYGTTIEIIDNTEKTEEQELARDLIQIVTVFSCRLQGKRANKAKKMIKELLENDIGEES